MPDRAARTPPPTHGRQTALATLQAAVWVCFENDVELEEMLSTVRDTFSNAVVADAEGEEC